MYHLPVIHINYNKQTFENHRLTGRLLIRKVIHLNDTHRFKLESFYLPMIVYAD